MESLLFKVRLSDFLMAFSNSCMQSQRILDKLEGIELQVSVSQKCIEEMSSRLFKINAANLDTKVDLDTGNDQTEASMFEFEDDNEFDDTSTCQPYSISEMELVTEADTDGSNLNSKASENSLLVSAEAQAVTPNGHAEAADSREPPDQIAPRTAPHKLTTSARPPSLHRACARMAKTLLASVFGIQEPVPRLAITGSRLIHPASPFNVLVSCVMLLLLTYSALITPIELAFNPSNPCSNLPTFRCNLVVDALFLLEVPYRFLVGIETPDGRYLERPAAVARAYAGGAGGLALDLATSIPFSWIDFAMMRYGCRSWPSDVAILRLAKPACAARHLGVLASSRALAALRDALARRAGLATLRCLFLFALLLVTMHYFACCYWRLTWQQSEEVLRDWLVEYGLRLDDMPGVYCLFFYFVSTFLTTVGYGDIVADNRR
jgi:hypothetical protein